MRMIHRGLAGGSIDDRAGAAVVWQQTASAGRTGQDLVDDAAQTLVVSPRPVDPVAVGAPCEAVVVGPDGRRQAVRDRRLRSLFDDTVARQAAHERVDGLAQPEAINHLHQLLPWLLGPDECRVDQGRSHEQLPVPGQHGASPLPGERHQGVVVEVLLVEAVEPQQAEIAGQLAEMSVEHESMGDRRRVEHWAGRRLIEAGPDLEPVAVTHREAEIHLRPVGLDASNLDVGNPDRLDHVARPAGKLELPHDRVRVAGEEIRQTSVE